MKLVKGEIALTREGGGLTLPVRLNDAITLKFVLDSGASDVTLPADVVSTLIRTGTIVQTDFIGDRTFVLADGSSVPSAEFKLHEIQVGNVMLHDVVASISDVRATPLLGQTFLSRLSGWSIDNKRDVLRISGEELHSVPALEASLPMPPPPPAATAMEAGSEAQPPLLGAIERGALQRVAQYFEADGGSGDPEAEGLRGFYAPEVTYYGKPTSRDKVMDDKQRFAARWPNRSYIMDPARVRASCDPTSRACVVTGIVRWTAKRQAATITSQGAASFTLAIRDSLIIVESSKVVSRAPS